MAQPTPRQSFSDFARLRRHAADPAKPPVRPEQNDSSRRCRPSGALCSKFAQHELSGRDYSAAAKIAVSLINTEGRPAGRPYIVLCTELLQKWQHDFFEALHDCVCFAEQLGWM